jgi:hypothetical protein
MFISHVYYIIMLTLFIVRLLLLLLINISMSYTTSQILFIKIELNFLTVLNKPSLKLEVGFPHDENVLFVLDRK